MIILPKDNFPRWTLNDKFIQIGLQVKILQGRIIIKWIRRRVRGYYEIIVPQNFNLHDYHVSGVLNCIK